MRSLTQYKLFVLGMALLSIGAFVAPQLKPKATVVEVVDESEPAQVADSTPQPAPVQRIRVPLDEQTFDATMVKLASSQHSNARAESPKQYASLPPPAPKQEPKKAPARVQLSSENWAQMTGYQRWKFVEAYVKSNRWICPDSGMSVKEQIETLAKYDWTTVHTFGFNKCTKPG